MDYLEIGSHEQLASFFREVDYLHDSILREVSILSRGFADSLGRLYDYGGASDARVVVHSQSARTPLIDLVFIEVKELRLDPSLELDLEGTLSPGCIEIWWSGRRNRDRSLLVAQAAKYRYRSRQSLGRRTCAVSDVPNEAATVPVDVGDGWSQCPGCLDAWLWPEFREFCRCPSCGRLCVRPSGGR